MRTITILIIMDLGETNMRGQIMIGTMVVAEATTTETFPTTTTTTIDPHLMEITNKGAVKGIVTEP